MDEVLRFERSTVLSEPQKAALRLAHSCLVDPAGFPAEHRAAALAHHTPAALVAMALVVVNAHGNKVNIALGRDAPLYGKQVGEVTAVELNDRGEYVPISGARPG